MSFAIVKGDVETDVLGAVAVARDVTQRVERERAAKQKHPEYIGRWSEAAPNADRFQPTLNLLTAKEFCLIVSLE